MFSGAKLFNGDISKWKVSRVSDMSAMFYGAKGFNGDISKWDVSSVSDMTDMFTNANFFFNSDLSMWDVSRVTSVMRIKRGTGMLNWERLNAVVKEGQSASQLSFVPGPEGGLRLAGSISPDGGTASCRTMIDEGTPSLGFSDDTVA